MAKTANDSRGTGGNLSAQETRQSTIWLEVSNVRVEDESVEIQVKGDRADREPVWWKVNLETAAGSPPVSGQSSRDTYRTIAEGLDKKRIVLANLGEGEGSLECKSIRVQYAESTSR